MMPRMRGKFVVCLRNDGYEASVEPRKIDQVVADNEAESHNMLGVIDESEEDYVFSASLFVSIALPQSLAKALALLA